MPEPSCSAGWSKRIPEELQRCLGTGISVLFAVPVLILFTMPHFRHLYLQILPDLSMVAEQISGTAQIQAFG